MAVLQIENNYPIIYDVSLEGGIDSKGNLKQVWNVDAIMNSIRMFFASYKGEIIRSPNSGGVLMSQLRKPMSEIDVGFLESVIRSSFTNEFRPKLQLNNVEVIPNFEKRYFEIVISAYSPDAGLLIEVDERIKAQV